MLILKDLFVNACIFITVFFIISQVFWSIEPRKIASRGIKILSGFINGFLGIILMVFSISITPSAIVDLRHLALIVAAVYLGSTATIITGLMLTVFRIFYYGVSSTSIMVGVLILISTAGSVFIGRLKISARAKWIAVFFYTTITFSITLFLAAKDAEGLTNIILYFWISSLASGIIAYYFTKYILDSNKGMRRLKEEATTDFLTGLNNTRNFDIQFNEILKKVKENNERVAFIAIDIDYFKKVNDTFGHSSGDEVLRELGRLLSRIIRDSDVVARVGGEEFSILLRGEGCLQAEEIAERIRSTVEKHEFSLPDGKKIHITVSIGISLYPGTVSEVEKIKEAADEKLYQAKRSGRNKVCA